MSDSQAPDLENISDRNVSSDPHPALDNVDIRPESASSPGPAGGEPVEKGKVDLLLKAVGDAPIMKKKRWAVDPDKKVAWVSEFVRKYIKCEPGESVFLYVNQYFSPAPDQEIGSLYECFGSDGKLVLHYCKQQAWG